MNGEVTLTREEMLEAAIVGCRRRIASIYDNRPDPKGSYNPNCPWMTDIEGAAAERALAKYMGVPWSGGVDTFKAPDVADFQVRSTTLPHGSLIIRPGDENDDEIYVLVTGACVRPFARYHIRGWKRCGDCKADHWLNSAGDAWFVRQSALRDLEEIGIYERQG